MMKLTEGGKGLADKFALACGVRSSPDVFVAARIFRYVCAYVCVYEHVYPALCRAGQKARKSYFWLD